MKAAYYVSDLARSNQLSTKKQAKEDERFRNAIEGKFGQAKRHYGLNWLMSKLSKTAENSIAITCLVINLSTKIWQVSCLFLSLFLNIYKLGLISDFSIIKADIQPDLLT